jgi:acyl-CoA reductase-like NAD-dependent aldehyde dehydrogenase
MTTKFGSDWTVPLWRDGEQVTTSKTFEIVSPLTGKPLYNASAASVEDANAAIASAEAAFPAWSKIKPSARRDLLLKAADELFARKDDLWHLCNTEVASTEQYFAFDFSDALEALKSTAGLISTVQGSMPAMLDEDRSAVSNSSKRMMVDVLIEMQIVVKEPFGVVGKLQYSLSELSR